MKDTLDTAWWAWDVRGGLGLESSKETRKRCCGNGGDAFSELTEIVKRQGPLWSGESLGSATVRGKI